MSLIVRYKPNAGLEKIPISQGLVTLLHISDIARNSSPCTGIAAPSASMDASSADVAASSADIVAFIGECFMMFHKVIQVFHDVFQVFHDVLLVIHDVLRVFHNVKVFYEGFIISSELRNNRHWHLAPAIAAVIGNNTTKVITH